MNSRVCQTGGSSLPLRPQVDRAQPVGDKNLIRLAGADDEFVCPWVPRISSVGYGIAFLRASTTAASSAAGLNWTISVPSSASGAWPGGM